MRLAKMSRPRSLPIFRQERRAFLCDHDDRRLGVGGEDRRKDAGVGHAKALDASDAKLFVAHAQGIGRGRYAQRRGRVV